MLLWAAVRFGVVGASGSILFLGILATWGVINGGGPFGTQPPTQIALSLDLYLVVTCMPLLLLAAVLEERNSLESAKNMSEARLRTLFENNIVSDGDLAQRGQNRRRQRRISALDRVRARRSGKWAAAQPDACNRGNAAAGRAPHWARGA